MRGKILRAVTIMIITAGIFAGGGSDAGFPAVNLDVSRYDNRSMNPQDSGNGFFIGEDRLTLTYYEGKYPREFPDAVNYLNTGIFVSDAVTSVGVCDSDKISAEVYTSVDRGEIIRFHLTSTDGGVTWKYTE